MSAEVRELLLGIDVGGTSVKAGLFATEGTLLAEGSIPTGDLTTQATYDQVCALLASLLDNIGAVPENVLGIGVDVPAPIDEQGHAPFVANASIDIPAFVAAISAWAPQAVCVPINDANAAALGELWQGAAQGEKSMVMVTLGTGVGGGIVQDGKLVAGRHGAGGEIGHMTVNPLETRTCGCGRKGCLEQYASAKGVVRAYKEACQRLQTSPVELTGPTDTYSIFQAQAQGDPAAQEAINQMCEYLAIAFAHIGVILDPATFVIGGGVSGSFDVFSDYLNARFRAHCLAPCETTTIVPASLGNRAGIYGSAYHALVAARS